MAKRGSEEYLVNKCIRFNKGMLAKLRENNYKPHWKDYDMKYLVFRLKEEVRELEDAIAEGDATKIARESHDVGNFAMMIEDNARREARTLGEGNTR